MCIRRIVATIISLSIVSTLGYSMAFSQNRKVKDCGKAQNNSCTCTVIFSAQAYGFTQAFRCKGLTRNSEASVFFQIDGDNDYGEGWACVLHLSSDIEGTQRDPCHEGPGKVTSKAIRTKVNNKGHAQVTLSIRECGHPADQPPKTCRSQANSIIRFNQK